MSILILLALIVLAMAGVGFTVFVFGRVIYFLSVDAIEIYSRGHNTGLDLDTRRAKLDYWREYAEIQIEQNRQKMLIGDGK